MTRSYRPSNGSEGLLFQHRFCNRCVHDKSYRDDPNSGGGCEIWGLAHVLSADDPDYPPELVRDEGDVFSGRCTAFEQDPDEPVYGPDTPRTFPLPSEIMGQVLGEILGVDDA